MSVAAVFNQVRQENDASGQLSQSVSRRGMGKGITTQRKRQSRRRRRGGQKNWGGVARFAPREQRWAVMHPGKGEGKSSGGTSGNPMEKASTKKRTRRESCAKDHHAQEKEGELREKMGYFAHIV